MPPPHSGARAERVFLELSAVNGYRRLASRRRDLQGIALILQTNMGQSGHLDVVIRAQHPPVYDPHRTMV